MKYVVFTIHESYQVYIMNKTEWENLDDRDDMRAALAMNVTQYGTWEEATEEVTKRLTILNRLNGDEYTIVDQSTIEQFITPQQLNKGYSVFFQTKLMELAQVAEKLHLGIVQTEILRAVDSIKQLEHQQPVANT